MNPLEGLDPKELISLSDVSFQEAVRLRARALTEEAMLTIDDVMHESEDDQARLQAAGKILELARAKDEAKLLPTGVSEEVFRIALAGLGLAAGLMSIDAPTAILRNVTPAKTDPRPLALVDDSPLNVENGPKTQAFPLDDYEIPGSQLIEENIDVEE